MLKFQTLIKYSKPRELFMNSENAVLELGKDKIDNYTGKSHKLHRL